MSGKATQETGPGECPQVPDKNGVAALAS